ncbi:MAG TPA: ParB/RepB/Spo0J family partition protein [Clostridiaceae bacterium]|nr:ParB/RepB/Spo0J family partition protein [Clostridiaceae bacterium]
MAKKALGKGLEALFPSNESIPTIESTDTKNVIELKINEIDPNVNQPRKKFDDEKLTQLAESIKQHGIVQPIIVKKEGNSYKIVAGERRWRAARIAGLTKVPVIIKDLSDREILEVALIENLQREDLNPIEEAEAYDKLINDYGLTQEELSEIIGKSRSAVANSVRLLKLSNENRKNVVEGLLSSGHARALLAIEDEELQNKIADEIILRDLNVRETEKLIRKYLKNKPVDKKIKNKDVEYVQIEEKLKDIFKTKVELQKGNKKGKILIEYYSDEELDRILGLFDKLA